MLSTSWDLVTSTRYYFYLCTHLQTQKLSEIKVLQYLIENGNGITESPGCAQVVLEFPHTFWEDSADFFGAAVPGGPEGRGRCFMFWNLHRMAEKPILITLMAGKAAYVSASFAVQGDNILCVVLNDYVHSGSVASVQVAMLRETIFLHCQESEKLSDEEMSAAAMEVLRRLFGEDIPQPVSLMTTKWGSDTYSRGAPPLHGPFPCHSYIHAVPCPKSFLYREPGLLR